MEQTLVDVAALRAVANRFETAAELVEGTRLDRLAFDGATAGQAHLTRGDALRAALGALGGELSQWARASFEIATALRTSAERYAEADLCGAARIG